ncbi:TrbC family F-type conjugative pilus assembly protein [Azospirillum sp. SYSU D00513]|uniref:TrbC family F-type conjugative pilus assembly protein n=1 Tax=Azospirillum sp. SYSU D00513 TaxID=2812561 RepID=UPI001A962F61|nr:TrbC family F-type conjugative pilus assembly protein [Azospirillum sp. SYSU D00513]
MRIVRGLTAAASLLIALPAAAGDDLQSIIDSSRQIKERALGMQDSADLLKPGAPIPRFSGPQSLPPGKGSGPAQGPGVTSGKRIDILVSWSLGDAVLMNLFRAVAGRPDVFVAFRGVPDGQTFGDGVKRLQAMARDLDPLPNVQIDPTRFRELSAGAVPAMALVQNGQVVAQVQGLLSPDYLVERVANGDTGNLGTLGPTVEIAEPDLIEVMQAKAQTFDLEAYKRKSIEGYWQKARFEELPQVVEGRVRRINPTIIVNRDIKDAKGNILVHAGQRINPLEKLPFTQRVIVFDASSPSQVETAKKLAAEGYANGKRRVTLIATRLDRTASWEGLKAVEDRLDAAVTLLTPDLRTRFKLEFVPSVIETDGTSFVITEVAPERM